MTARLPLSTALLLLNATLYGQLHAGEVPAGYAVHEPGTTIVLDEPFTSAKKGVNPDCDGQMDMKVALDNGNPLVDAPNTAYLRIIDDSLEFCAEPGTIPRLHLFEEGELLENPEGKSWVSQRNLILGDFGGRLAKGPSKAKDVFVAYRRNSEMGWIKLSFTVEGMMNPVRLKVKSVLPLCQSHGGTKAMEQTQATAPVLFPNPSTGEPIQLDFTGSLTAIEVIDAAGRVLAQYPGSTRAVAAPAHAGSYFLRTTDADGKQTMTRFVRF